MDQIQDSRQADTIEITPAMICAGVREFALALPDAEEALPVNKSQAIVAAIFRVMEECRGR
jgi:hypothetical protein